MGTGMVSPTGLMCWCWLALGCGSAGQQTAALPATPPRDTASSVTVTDTVEGPLPDSLPLWIRPDPATRTVYLTLLTEPSAGGAPAAINGFHHGGAQLVVPLGWTVKWTWTNADSTGSHSLVVVEEREKLPAEAGRPALVNAVTRNPLNGMKPGQRDVTTFEADQAGWYWLLCGVAGHALQGEWIGLKVDREATAPGVTFRER